MNELPKGWQAAKLTDVCDVSTGKVDANHASEDGDYTFFTCALKPFKAHTFSFEGELITLPGNGANVGHVNYYSGKMEAYQRTYVLHRINIIPRYLFWQLKLAWKSTNLDKQYGSATNYLKIGNFTNYILPIAPLNEQIRIADKLDSILAKVNKAQSRLEKIPVILKRFRQSVLVAATSGELTKEWRNKNSIDLDGWKNVTLADVALSLDPNPSHRYPKADSSGVPILSTQQFIGTSGWTTDKAKLVSREFYEERKAKTGFFENDIIFARKGRLGLARFSPKNMEFVLSHTVFIVRPFDLIIPEYLLWMLRDDQVMEWLNREMNSNTGVPTLGKKVFEKLPILLPCLKEQKEILCKIQILLEKADKVEAQFLEAKSRLDRLTQSILAKAFRGELVSQNDKDESAEALLKRIKAESPKVKSNKK